MNTQNSLLFVAGVLILGAVTWAGITYPLPLIGTSPSGTTFGTAKFAGVAVNLAAPGANATSSSILNTDANDRYVSAVKIGCSAVGTSKTAYSGAGLASLTVTIATTSTAAPIANANTNTLPVATIATATPQFTLASSTAGTPGSGTVSTVWAAGSYMTFTTNATNTALCTFGIDYFGS